MSLRIGIALLALTLGEVAHAGVLRVERLSGDVQAQRGTAGVALKDGDELAQGDVVRVAPGGRVTLALGRHGFLDLGAGSELAVERLPFSSYADDLQTVLRLGRGYLRVSWKYPEMASRWPLAVYLSGYSAGLGGGEYFFESAPAGHTACVGSGQATLAGAPAAATLTGPACYRLVTGAMPEARRRDYADFISPRERYALGDLPDRVAAAGPPFASLPKAAATADPMVFAAPTSAAARGQGAATPAAGDRWTIVVASYLGEAEAAGHSGRLARAGRQARIEAAQVKGQTWYRVLLPDIDGKAQAQRLLDELKAGGEPSGAWLVRQR